MAFSTTFGRKEEKKQQKRLIIALIGSILLLLFIAVFGLRLLIGFSVLVEKLRGGNTPAIQDQQTYITAPILNPLPEATNSAQHLTVTGQASAGSTLVLYLNDAEEKKLTVDTNGLFSITGLPLREGKNTLSAKTIGDKGEVSDLSNIVFVTIKKTPPTLDITNPSPNATIHGETKSVDITGTTDEDATVMVNTRLIVVRSDKTFQYTYPLNDGENILKITATDRAGNQTVIERRVIYER